MIKRIIYAVFACLMVVMLLFSSCSLLEDQTTANATITAEDSGQTITAGSNTTDNASEPLDDDIIIDYVEAPEYGGTLNLYLVSDPNWDLFGFDAGYPQLHAHEKLYEGNWIKGSAGGWGDGVTTWSESTNIPDLNTGYLVSDYYWEVSSAGDEVTAYFTVRDEVFFAQPDTEAGRKVGGRQLTVDDLIWNVNQRIHNQNSQYYQLYPSQRYPVAEKVGPDTFSVTYKVNDFFGTMTRQNWCTLMFAPELFDAYGYKACTDWQYSVGTGPYMISDYIRGKSVDLIRNPDYWMTDPVGYGKGNQLPYIEKIRYIVMADEETRLVAFRTGKLDQISNVLYEDSETLKQSKQYLQSAESGSRSEDPLFMNSTVAPFNDVRVRQALMMGTDFNGINDDLYGGKGNIISWPYTSVAGYEPLFVSPDDPDIPDDVKALYVYDTAKAQEYLVAAGYPEGFSTTLVCEESEADYYTNIADMWAGIGITLTIEPVVNTSTVASTVGYDGLIALGSSPNSSYPEQLMYAARNWRNASMINQPYIDDLAVEVRTTALRDFQGSMQQCRPLVMELLDLAYVIPSPQYPVYTLWWPWLYNYSGEASVGLYPGNSWVTWCWIDETLKVMMDY